MTRATGTLDPAKSSVTVDVRPRPWPASEPVARDTRKRIAAGTTSVFVSRYMMCMIPGQALSWPGFFVDEKTRGPAEERWSYALSRSSLASVEQMTNDFGTMALSSSREARRQRCA
jgi:hypothetical protein